MEKTKACKWWNLIEGEGGGFPQIGEFHIHAVGFVGSLSGMECGSSSLCLASVWRVEGAADRQLGMGVGSCNRGLQLALAKRTQAVWQSGRLVTHGLTAMNAMGRGGWRRM